MTTAPATPTVPRRRNGRQQACEPCRKRKVACDHSLPSCGRCKKKNAEGRCVYLIATPGPSTSVGRIHGVPTISSTSRTAVSIRSPAGPRPRAPPPLPSPPAAGSPSLISASPSSAAGPLSPGALSPPRIAPDSPGYLGPTSFSAVFREAGDHLSPSASHHRSRLDGGTGGDPLTGDTLSRLNGSPGGMTVHDSHLVASSKIEQCIQILLAIPPPDRGMMLFDKTDRPMDSWMRNACEYMIKSMWQTFGDCLGLCSPEGLRAMAEIICTNSSTPLNEDIDDPQEWLDSFSGRNLRWESIGVVFNCLAIGALESNFREAMLTYKDCAQRCAALCRQAGQANCLLLLLVYKNAIAESMVSGDTSLECSILTAETIALTTYLGLHVEPSSETRARKVTASAEVKRRLFYSVFLLDKAGSICSGRPPMLNRRYITTLPPLDISNQVLLGSKEQIASAVEELDPNGWNTDFGPSPVKTLRARIYMGVIRDEILELALTSSNLRQAREQLMTLRDREIRETAQLPDILVFHPSDMREGILRPTDLYGKIILRLEHLQNMFFIERLLIKAGQEDCSSLVAVSVEIVTLTLALWTHRDCVTGQHRDFEWIVIAFAAPAGGVLCMELLKPPHQSVFSSSSDPNLARSNIVQQLSLLVSFLDWIGPSAPNARLCVAVKEAVQHVLNQVLNNNHNHNHNSTFAAAAAAPHAHPQPPPATVAASSALNTDAITAAAAPVSANSAEPAAMEGGGDNDNELPSASQESSNFSNTAASHPQQQQHYYHQGQQGGLMLQDLELAADLTEFFNFDLLDTFDFLRPDQQS